MDLHDFADPWEHVRMLADGRRNRALEALLERRAPGARVLEVGAGTGIWSLVAARCGAAHVLAVEPTETAALVRQLVADNGLQGTVEVLEATVEDLEPRPVDLAFAELLNVDPFAEGLADVLTAATAWLAPGGHLAPRRLRVWLQALDAPESANERAGAQATVARLAERRDLELGALRAFLEPGESYRYAVAQPALIGTPTLALDLSVDELGEDLEAEVSLEVSSPVHGVAVWWEAELDDGIAWSNEPGVTGAWDRLAITWPHPAEPVEGRVTVSVSVDDDALEVRAY